ncbi:MAG: hypothetical protein H6766_07215 [Candidatus Peribacteria bacterium]|nr:MAG: hypothetical protein H6766_07215 [Candidatus Peribacteria bacterium]
MLLLARCWEQIQQSDTILHVWIGHHGVREDADEDVELVRQWCVVRGLQCVVGHYNGEKTETAMRQWRYEQLLSLAGQYDACVLTGHHLDDRIETAMLRLWRGTGILGLGPIGSERVRKGEKG